MIAAVPEVILMDTVLLIWIDLFDLNGLLSGMVCRLLMAASEAIPDVYGI